MSRTVIFAASFALLVFGVGLSEGGSVAAGDDCFAIDECDTSLGLFCDMKDNICKYLIGQPCPKNTGDCAHSSECSVQPLICTCIDGSVSSEDKRTCLLPVGHTCTDADPCIANAQCLAKSGTMVCVCKPRYTITASDNYSVCAACSGTSEVVVSALTIIFAVFFTSRLM